MWVGVNVAFERECLVFLCRNWEWTWTQGAFTSTTFVIV